MNPTSVWIADPIDDVLTRTLTVKPELASLVKAITWTDTAGNSELRRMREWAPKAGREGLLGRLLPASSGNLSLAFEALGQPCLRQLELDMNNDCSLEDDMIIMSYLTSSSRDTPKSLTLKTTHPLPPPLNHLLRLRHLDLELGFSNPLHAGPLPPVQVPAWPPSLSSPSISSSPRYPIEPLSDKLLSSLLNSRNPYAPQDSLQPRYSTRAR
ncbi:hypothetical protein JCM11641_001689 [Rhodosporidiobolus odoratus]